MEFDKLLRLVVEKGASDLFITAGKPPMLKINGTLYAAGKSSYSPEQSRDQVLGVMNKDQQAQFLRDRECNFAINTTPSAALTPSMVFQSDDQSNSKSSAVT